MTFKNLILIPFIFLASCEKQDDVEFYPCEDGKCDSVFFKITINILLF